MRRLDRLEPPDVEAVLALAAAAEANDGVEALGERTLLDVAGGGTPATHLLLRPPGHATPSHRRAAPLLGYATVRDRSGELVVEPRHRRRGLGRLLLRAVRDAGGAAVWAHGRLPGAEALADAEGWRAERELWRMERSLEPGSDPPAVDPPHLDGLVVRPFVVGQDEDAWLRVNARAFAHHPEQGRMTLADLVAREGEPWFDAGDLLLAEQDGRLVASAWLKVQPGADTGELYVLGVDPDAQGQGLGRHLTACALARLAGRGLRRAALYVSATDTPAVRTYRRAGFTRTRVDVQYAAPQGPGSPRSPGSGSISP